MSLNCFLKKNRQRFQFSMWPLTPKNLKYMQRFSRFLLLQQFGNHKLFSFHFTILHRFLLVCHLKSQLNKLRILTKCMHYFCCVVVCTFMKFSVIFVWMWRFMLSSCCSLSHLSSWAQTVLTKITTMSLRSGFQSCRVSQSKASYNRKPGSVKPQENKIQMSELIRFLKDKLWLLFTYTMKQTF